MSCEAECLLLVKTAFVAGTALGMLIVVLVGYFALRYRQ